MNRIMVSVGLSLAGLTCQSELAQAQPASSGEAIIVLDGNSYALQVFECRRDYPSPIEPDRTLPLRLALLQKERPTICWSNCETIAMVEAATRWRLWTRCLRGGPC